MTIMFYPKSDQINRSNELSLTKDVAAVTVFGMQAVSTRAFASDKDTWMKINFLTKIILLLNCSADAKFTALIEQGNFQPNWRSVPIGYLAYLRTHVECFTLHSVCVLLLLPLQIHVLLYFIRPHLCISLCLSIVQSSRASVLVSDLQSARTGCGAVSTV